MKTLVIVTALVIVSLFGVGLYQNYANSLASCEKYKSSDTMYRYECPDGKTYYTTS